MPIIQIHHPYAQPHGYNGEYFTFIDMDILLWLLDRYNKAILRMDLSLTPPPLLFQKELYLLSLIENNPPILIPLMHVTLS